MYRMALTWILMLQMWPSGAVKFIPVGSTPGGAPRMPFIGRMQLFLATGNKATGNKASGNKATGNVQVQVCGCVDQLLKGIYIGI